METDFKNAKTCQPHFFADLYFDGFRGLECQTILLVKRRMPTQKQTYLVFLHLRGVRAMSSSTFDYTCPHYNIEQ
jgi:hypothetical protein